MPSCINNYKYHLSKTVHSRCKECSSNCKTWLYLFTVTIWIFAFLTAGCDNTAPSHSQNQSVYIWQRAWNDSTTNATKLVAHEMSKFYVLTAEIEMSKTQPNVIWVEPDYALLKQSGKPVVLCIRIGQWQGPFTESHTVTKTLISTIENRIKTFQAKGIQPDEIQIDFDCSESNLDGYSQWLQEIREVSEDISLSITVLPSWLEQKKFKNLIKKADSYVLQVHGLQKDHKQAAKYNIFIKDRAIEWAKSADKYKKPFTVALPTYGYQLFFNADNDLIDVVAEEKPKLRNANSKLLKTNPHKVAKLINEWSLNHPKWMQGIIWYRLPTDQDKLNWTIDTLKEVMYGRTPKRALNVYLKTEKLGQQRIWLENTGQTMINDFEIEIIANTSAILAADLTLSNKLKHDEGSLTISPNNGEYIFLRPGEKYSPGWLRLAKNNEISAITVQ